jgi:hypothetical protein
MFDLSLGRSGVLYMLYTDMAPSTWHAERGFYSYRPAVTPYLLLLRCASAAAEAFDHGYTLSIEEDWRRLLAG